MSLTTAGLGRPGGMLVTGGLGTGLLVPRFTLRPFDGTTTRPDTGTVDYTRDWLGWAPGTVITRPSVGVTAHATGTTTRPGAGTTSRPAAGLTTRPDTGTTTEPGGTTPRPT